MRGSTLAALALVALLDAAAATGCGPGDACEREENLLLQHQRSADVKRVREKRSTNQSIAMALSGGGFLAHSTLSGIFAGLLNFTSIEDLFQNVEVVAVASAAAWFIPQLTYSPTFLNLIQTMAGEPSNAGHLYATQWVQKFLFSLATDKAHMQHATKQTYAEILRAQDQMEDLMADKSLFGLDQDFLEFLVEFYWASTDGYNRTWVELIEQVLSSTSENEVNSALTLGSPVNPFAQGKKFVMGTSLVTPGDPGPGSCHDKDASGLVCVGPRNPEALVYRNQSKSLAYSGRAEGQDVKSMASFTPARFSVELGSGPGQPAPMTFCPSCGHLAVTYQKTGSSQSVSTTSVNTFNFDSSTPLVAAAAAGSAFLGELIVLPFFNAQYFEMAASTIANLVEKIPFVGEHIRDWLESKLFNVFMLQFPVWSMTAVNGPGTFEAGAELIQQLDATGGELSEQLFENVVQNKLLAMIDAGLTDNTAIGHAIASGHDNILAMDYSAMSNFPRLLAGQKTDWQIIHVPELNFCPLCYSNFQVFQQDESTVKAMKAEHLKSFTLKDGITQLKSLKVGILSLTTVKNSYFGIEAGRNIKLHVISADSRSGIGGVGYQTYKILVQDIVDTFRDPANSELVSEVMGWL